jgi:riboflavin synthase
MFTGIIEERGRVHVNDHGRLVVECSKVAHDAEPGDSIAVSGVCLTVVERGDGRLGFDVSQETSARTSLARLGTGDPVNLERPVTLAARLGGHLVQGHADDVGEIIDVEPETDGGVRLRVRIPAGLLRYVVAKGSIAIEGVSLTVAELHDDGVTIALVPHTLAATTLGTAGPGDPVNLEVDMISKYVERLMGEAR